MKKSYYWNDMLVGSGGPIIVFSCSALIDILIDLEKLVVLDLQVSPIVRNLVMKF